MDESRNPYSPGAGRTPVALVGRDTQVRQWDVALERIEAGRDARPIVLYGLRGVGKTVLLSHFARTARARDWIVAKVEAGSGKPFRAALAEQLHGPLSDLARPNAGRRLLKALKTAVSFRASIDQTGSFSFGMDLTESSGGGADTGVLETDLAKLVRDLSAAAREEAVGVAILVDEAQDLTTEELVALCVAAHEAGQDNAAAAFALAGLPSLPRILAEAKSYAERLFAFEPIERLTQQLAFAAVTDPARHEGVEWDGDAVWRIVEDTHGYPYFLQQFGQDTWNTATGPIITVRDAELGSARAARALDNGFFRARWDRATPAERDYLRAMAVDGDTVSQSGQVAERLRRKASSLGPARASLIAKGLIYAPEHGRIAFTVPGMAEFIKRQHDP